MKTIILLNITLLASMLVIILVYAYSKLAKQKMTDKLIDGARERLENQKYDIENNISYNTEKFLDSSQLVIPFSGANVRFNRHAPVNRQCYFHSLGIDAENTTIEENSVAVLMPFNSRFDKQYAAFREVCDNVGMICHRSDERHNPGNLLSQIVEMILKSQIIIALIDGKNPNVFYEIGIAHSIGKPVILVASKAKMEDIPQDIIPERMLIYDNIPDLKTKLSKALKQISYIDD